MYLGNILYGKELIQVSNLSSYLVEMATKQKTIAKGQNGASIRREITTTRETTRNAFLPIRASCAVATEMALVNLLYQNKHNMSTTGKYISVLVCASAATKLVTEQNKQQVDMPKSRSQKRGSTKAPRGVVRWTIAAVEQMTAIIRARMYASKKYVPARVAVPSVL